MGAHQLGTHSGNEGTVGLGEGDNLEEETDKAR